MLCDISPALRPLRDTDFYYIQPVFSGRLSGFCRRPDASICGRQSFLKEQYLAPKAPAGLAGPPSLTMFEMTVRPPAFFPPFKNRLFGGAVSAANFSGCGFHNPEF
jgi:hypothetical protein